MFLESLLHSSPLTTTRSPKLIAAFFTFIVLLFLLATAASAQDIPANAETSENATSSSVANQPFLINMRAADIRAFIQWIAEKTRKNIIVHKTVRGEVTIISHREVTSGEAYELFLTVLQMNGFAVVNDGNAIKVIPETEAKTNPLASLSNAQNRGEMVLSLIDIKNADVAAVIGAVKPLLPNASHVVPYKETNTIILVANARDVERTTQLIGSLDKAEAATDIEIVAINHASAKDIEKVVSKLLTTIDPEKATSLVMEERTNAIIISAPKKKMTKIKALIEKLDKPLSGGGNTRVVYLNYIEAEEITPILKSVGDAIIKEAKSEEKTSFSIESSKTTNALIISAPPSVQGELQAVIKKLDIQRAQVLIEAVVVQVRGDNGDDFGVVWGASDIYNTPLDGSVAGVNLPTSSGTPGSTVAGIAGSDDALTSNTLAAGLLSSSGLTFGYLEDGNLIGALQLISTQSSSNIMSTPTVVALDNEEASLLVGQNVPFVTGSSTSGSSSTNNPFQTVQRQDIGITLKVTPRINQGDSITLEIDQTTENVNETAVGGAVDLVTDKTEITTNALIKDGQVLVLGGLIREDRVKTHNKIPILGDIPFAGRLFRSSGDNKSKTNLMVFIRPTILKDQLQINDITAERYAFMREKQMSQAINKLIRRADKPLLDEYETYQPSE